MRRFVWAPLAAAGAQQVSDGGELFFGLGRPFLLFDGGDDGFFGREDFEGDLLGLDFVGSLPRRLIVGAEPADEAVAFFFGAFSVEGDEVFENLFVGDVMGPAVGVENGVIKVVMDF